MENGSKLMKLKRTDIPAFIFSLLLTAVMIFGPETQQFQGIHMVPSHLLSVLGISAAAAYGFAILWRYLKVYLHQAAAWLAAKKFADVCSHAHSRLIIGGILLLGWLPAFLAFFPSNWAYDTDLATEMIYTGVYSAKEPLVFTFIVKFFLFLGNALGSTQIGLALYTVCQMLLLAYSLSTAIHVISCRYHVPAFVQWILILFFALVPFNQVFAVTAAKDVLFASVFPLVIVSFAEMMDAKTPFTWKENLKYILICTFWVSLRNNAAYALIVFAVFAGLISGWKKTIVYISLISSIGFSAVNTAAVTINNWGYSSPMETLSVPMVQLARVAHYHLSDFSSDDQAMMKLIFPTDNYRAYDPYIADSVKIKIQGYSFRNRDNVIGFVSLCRRMMQAYPGDFANSFLLLNVGSYYPLDQTYARVYIDYYQDGIKYTKPASEIKTGYISTDFMTCPKADFHPATLLPSVRSFYESICTDNSFFGNIPVMLLLSPATYFWILVLAWIHGFAKHDKPVVLMGLLPLLYWATQMLGPCALSRYLYLIMLGAPLILIYSLYRQNAAEQTK